MRTQASPKLDASTVAARLGMCAAALAGTAGMVTDANATVVTFSTPIAIPNTFAGVYINLLTGANAITPGAVPGWDFGPWGSSNTLSFFFPSTPANAFGAVAGTTTGPYLDLTPGTTIGASSTFAAVTATTATTAFQATGTHTMGFRFFNETTSAINFGYLTMTTTGPLGFPATITGWSFENSGGSITIPAVPEPATTGMFALGALALGAANLRRIRRQRKLAA